MCFPRAPQRRGHTNKMNEVLHFLGITVPREMQLSSVCAKQRRWSCASKGVDRENSLPLSLPRLALTIWTRVQERKALSEGGASIRARRCAPVLLNCKQAEQLGSMLARGVKREPIQQQLFGIQEGMGASFVFFVKSVRVKTQTARGKRSESLLPERGARSEGGPWALGICFRVF